VKPTKATIAKRVEEFVQIVLDGAEPHDLRLYVSERQADADSPWARPEGKRPLSDRQIRRYAARAEGVIAESCRTSRKKLLRRHLARRRNLYAKAVSAGDIRTALACLADEARLTGLYDPPPVPKPTGGTPTTAAAVVAILAARLASIDRARLPPGEHARLTTGVADCLLRAVDAADLEKQLADLAERVERLSAPGKGAGRAG
jgi:hypothetical protein